MLDLSKRWPTSGEHRTAESLLLPSGLAQWSVTMALSLTYSCHFGLHTNLSGLLICSKAKLGLCGFPRIFWLYLTLGFGRMFASNLSQAVVV